MHDYLVIVALGTLAVLILTELVAAVLPVVIVIAAVPPEERDSLAKLLATCDSSRKLRVWPALRLAVHSRREETRRSEAERRDAGRREAAGLRAVPARMRPVAPGRADLVGGGFDQRGADALRRPAGIDGGVKRTS